MNQEESVEWSVSESPKRYKRAIPVNEYSLKGNYITTYSSIFAAAKKWNVADTTISKCCNGLTLQVKSLNRIFLYADSDINERLKKIEEHTGNHTMTGIIVREYLMTGEYVRPWSNIMAVVNAFGVNNHDIRDCIEGKKLYIKDRIFLTGTETVAERIALIEEEKQKLREQKLKRQRKENFIQAIQTELQIKAYTSDGTFLKLFSSAREAANTYNLTIHDIENSLTGKSLVVKGLVFIPYSDSIEERLNKIKNRKTHKNNL